MNFVKRSAQANHGGAHIHRDLQIPKAQDADEIDLQLLLHLQVPDDGHWERRKQHVGENVERWPQTIKLAFRRKTRVEPLRESMRTYRY